MVLGSATALLGVVSTALLSAMSVQAASLESVLAGQANLTTFRGLIKKHPDIFGKFSGEVTIAAPNDNAFGKLGDWDSYSDSRLDSTLHYHVLKGSITTTSLLKGDSIWAATDLTDKDYTSVSGGQHLILNKQPSEEVVLTSGFATRGTIVVEDLSFDNGKIQIIDSVMRVPEGIESTARSAYTDLTAFVGALYAADLIDEVAGQKDVTIFAPRNAAFQQLAGTFERMDTETLRRVLRYHVVPGRVSHIWELKNESVLASAENGNKLAITRHTNFIYVNSAEILQADILVSNGVVHLIDNVLGPDEANARPNFSLTAAQPPVLTQVGATATGTGVPTPFASDLPCTASCPPAEASGGVNGGYGTAYGQDGSSTNGGIALPRCTGLAGAGVGVGIAAIGAMMAL
ncbi:FAS1 domain-containing protein [Chaetomium sp. MPI-SDFR-AT-0129]|nr:FAS1 domain-containing protein [Chaetomium sp. MPI-SDFR-AT-0129]